MTPKEVNDCVDMGIPLTGTPHDDRLRDELAYQLTHTKIGRVHSFADALQKLTHMTPGVCVKIAERIFEENL